MTFARKSLTATIQLAKGVFEGGGNTLTISGLRMSARITCVMNIGQTVLNNLSIWGLTLSQMNQLSITGTKFSSASVQKNYVIVQASDGVGQPSTVFEGQINEAWIDPNPPDVRFVCSGSATHWIARKPVSPISQAGAVQASSLAQQLASVMGLQFENNGVNTVLSNPYLHGTAYSQLRQLGEGAGFNYYIDKGTLAIWPPNGSRAGATPLISPKTGLVGYPVFNEAQILVRTYFNPAIVFGANIQVQSSITSANGIWTINKLTHELDALVPKGSWFSEISATVAKGGGTGNPPTGQQ